MVLTDPDIEVTASSAGGAAPPAPPLLTAQGLTKSFAGTCVLDRVSLSVQAGEIVALLGQNGSGKSTLVKILAGVYRADAGRITLRHPVDSATKVSLHVIHQDLGLVETLSSIENLALGRDRGGLRPLHHKREAVRARRLLADFGLHVDVHCPIRSLTPAQRTIVAIARAMDGWAGPHNLLVLDEPTAALHGNEVQQLFSAVRRVARQGAGVIFISHRLDEIRELADRLIVLRDGRLVADRDAEDMTTDALAALITGRAATPPSAATTAGPTHTEARGLPALSIRGLGGGTVSRVDLDIDPGEIVGVAGALGSGREDLAGLVFGALPRRTGTVVVAGAPIARPTPHRSKRSGMAYVPADRRARGAVMSLSLRENLALPDLTALSAARIHLRRRREREAVRTWTQRLDIRPAEPERRLELFSGGNQQKAVIAKWLRLRPRVLLLDEPTQGVDVGASRAIRRLLRDARAEGMAVLIASSDNKDLTDTCDRVLVMRDGTVACELTGDDINDHRITQECLGSRGEIATGRSLPSKETP